MRRTNREESRLRIDFMKGQKYTYHDLSAEISAGHFATAHRLAHTLKGIAGLIGEAALADIALKIEKELRNQKTPDSRDMQILENELNRVLAEITNSGILDEGILNTPPTIDEQIVLFNKLQTYLEENDAACLEILPEIAIIYETKVLVRQVEKYDFKDALTTLKVLREVLGI
jgi:HPt (histidine-containing phosphotransfer) domain-containing protein